MAFSQVISASIHGLTVDLVSVEADVSNGLPRFDMVGYLSNEVKEASERVRTAIANSGKNLLPKKIIVNLSPARIRKKGSSYDLPIAMSILLSMQLLKSDRNKDILIIGELGLDGDVKKVNGILPIVLEAKKRGIKKIILPYDNQKEGLIVSGIEIIGVQTLLEVCDYFDYGKYNKVQVSKDDNKNMINTSHPIVDFSDIIGQEFVKRAAEVAVSGGHNLLLVGPPGSGKSMIASSIPSILPTLDMEDSMDVTKVYSILGLLDEEHPLIDNPPFRSAHHTITRSALIGGGVSPIPGEISLAHKGVLFLDELAEFAKPVLEVLRQPMEERVIRISRSYRNVVYPSDFILVAAMNPCPCGNYPDFEKCTCSPNQITNYLSHISQPILDRIDICVEAPKVKYSDLKSERKGETSSTIRERVIRTRKIQEERYRNLGIKENGRLSPKDLKKYCLLDKDSEKVMKEAYEMLSLTARTYHKILKVARTIADMDEKECIELKHLKEAIGYRGIDKKYWGR
ncbi:MAG: YifB family Mg chelatase-like AAA ATPase [Lachnospiraceae bacterium]|jgi:magnesium chelatase family protein|nr:YifB family Mg chelatase-like AAA ATPase [Lachnospiraceae bacterium]